jgi:hypothetical protein
MRVLVLLLAILLLGPVPSPKIGRPKRATAPTLTVEIPHIRHEMLTR